MCILRLSVVALAGVIFTHAGVVAAGERSLQLKSRTALTVGTEKFSVRDFHQMGDYIGGAGALMQSSGVYGYLTLPKKYARDFSPVVQLTGSNTLFGGQSCSNGSLLLDQGSTALSQAILSVGADGTISPPILNTITTFPTSGCAWTNRYLYLAGQDGGASRIATVDTDPGAPPAASVVASVGLGLDAPNTPTPFTLRAENHLLYAKTKYHGQIQIFSLQRPELPAWESSVNTQPQAMDVPLPVPCASENQFCKFSGTKLVKYGGAGVFSSLVVTDGVFCSNDLFGDPIVGTIKTCFYEEIAAIPTTTYRSINDDLYVDPAYVISANTLSKTVQIFAAAAPHDEIQMLFMDQYPTAVYRVGSLLFVSSSAMTGLAEASDGALDVYSVPDFRHLAHAALGVRLPVALWSDGYTVLVGGAMPVTAEEPTYEVWEYRE